MVDTGLNNRLRAPSRVRSLFAMTPLADHAREERGVVSPDRPDQVGDRVLANLLGRVGAAGSLVGVVVVGVGVLAADFEILRYLALLLQTPDGRRPGGLAQRSRVGGVAAPDALDERGGGCTTAVQVLLALHGLDFEGEAGAEDAGRQGEEGNADESAAAGQELAARGFGVNVAVAWERIGV